MEIVMLGAPGTGKGTVGKLLSKEFEIPHISMGEIFRSYCKKHTKLALEATKYMNAGTLVPDEITCKLIENRLNEEDVEKGFILDGFPRNVEQADKLQEILAKKGKEINIVVHLSLPDDEIIDRISKRRTCPNPECREIYNLEFRPPKEEGICDLCGSKLIIRSDDNEETVRKRLKTFHETSEELIEYYKKQALLYTIKLNKESNVTTMGVAEEIRSYFE